MAAEPLLCACSLAQWQHMICARTMQSMLHGFMSLQKASCYMLRAGVCHCRIVVNRGARAGLAAPIHKTVQVLEARQHSCAGVRPVAGRGAARAGLRAAPADGGGRVGVAAGRICGHVRRAAQLRRAGAPALGCAVRGPHASPKARPGLACAPRVPTLSSEVRTVFAPHCHTSCAAKAVSAALLSEALLHEWRKALPHEECRVKRHPCAAAGSAVDGHEVNPAASVSVTEECMTPAQTRECDRDGVLPEPAGPPAGAAQAGGGRRAPGAAGGRPACSGPSLDLAQIDL